VFFELLLDDAPISHEAPARHVVLVLEVKDFLLEFVDGCLNLTFLLDNFVQLPALLQSFQLFQFLLVIIDDLFVINQFSAVDILA